MKLLKTFFLIIIFLTSVAVAGPLEWGFTESPIPESAQMFLLGILLVGLAAYGRKKLYNRE